jgi:tetratricopeptide (TPR) repeat protein
MPSMRASNSCCCRTRVRRDAPYETNNRDKALNERDPLRRKLSRRVRQADEADLPALTILRARAFLAVFPTYGPVWYQLGQALRDIARYEEAEAALQKAIEFCPPEKLWCPYGAMGHLFKALGDYGRAAKWYERTIDVAPDDADGYIYLGGILALQGRLAEAEAVHRKATRRTQGCLDEAFLNLGLVLRAQERFTEAAECFEEAIRRDPDYRDAKKALRDVSACIGESTNSSGQGMTDPSPCNN